MIKYKFNSIVIQGYGILKYIRTITVWEQEFGPFTISATSSTK